MKPVLRFLAIPVAGCAISAYAVARVTDPAVSATRAFFFGGRWYAVGKRTTGESVLQNELAKAGYAISRRPEDSEGPLTYRIDALSTIDAKNSPRPLHLPSRFARFHADDSLRTESGTHTVDIANGTIAGKPALLRNALVAAGWHVVTSDHPGKPYCIATMKHGREMSVVVLEEDTGSVLVLRHLEK